MLKVFKSLPIAREAVAADSLPEGARSFSRDTITLGWEDRLKARGRRRSDGGHEFAIALPRGTILRAGHCLVLPSVALVISVVEREEPVFVIVPRSAREWGLFAYHIGNNHQPMMIAGDEIVCADGPGVELLLEQHGIPFTRSVRAFTPVANGPDHRHSEC